MSGTDELAVFVKVVEKGSFTAAARALQMPKSSISRNIARLEERLGVRLLNRTTRSLATTEAGATFYEHCVDIVAAIAAAEDALGQSAAPPQGPLSIAAPARAIWLAPIVTAFLGQHPAVQLSVVRSGPADVVLSAAPPEDAASPAQRLARTRHVLCASPAYLQQRPAPAAPEALAGHACLLLGSHTTGSWRIGGRTVAVSGPLASADGALLRDAALAGLGIARLPGVSVEALLAAGALSVVLPGQLDDDALFVSIARPSSAARVLTALVVERLG